MVENDPQLIDFVKFPPIYSISGKKVEKMPEIIEMHNTMRRMLVDTRQLWDAYRDAWKRRQSFEGGLTWKTSNGRDYLIRIYADIISKSKKQTSLGARSPETERIFTEFKDGKEEATRRVASLTARLEEQARLNKAIGLGRVPTIAARVLRLLDRTGLLGRNIIVSGTNSLFAYEAAAGVLIERSLMATEDLDLLMDARARLKLTVDGLEAAGLLGLLHKVDRSFAKASSAFRAVNRDGFFVDLIKAEPTPPWKEERDAFGEKADLEASPIPNMRWIANAPKFQTVAIGEDGMPVPIACADPRAFALYKLWMGTQDPTRDPVKRGRDIAQAEVVASIVHGHFPQLQFEPEHLSSFPKAAIDLAQDRPDPFFS